MKKLFWLSILVFFGWSCSSDEQSARLEVWLTDAPGDYEEVNIDIQGVEVHSSEGDQGDGWHVLEVQSGVYNLLELTNGLDTLLASAELPAGRISQIRLKLGNNNTLKIDGQEVSLVTPSGQQSGLKLNVHADLTAGVVYTVLLDFDAARSIVQRGNGTYALKPVIRTITEATSGAIKGVVNPVESMPAVFAIHEQDTLATTYADAEGKFLLRGVPPGTYKVSFNPKEGYQPLEVDDVDVMLGSATDMGTVTIQL